MSDDFDSVLKGLEEAWDQDPIGVLKGLVGSIQVMARQIESQAILLMELQSHRDTGAIHKMCQICQQIIPVTLGGSFVKHSRVRRGPGIRYVENCQNSGGQANG